MEGWLLLVKEGIFGVAITEIKYGRKHEDFVDVWQRWQNQCVVQHFQIIQRLILNHICS